MQKYLCLFKKGNKRHKDRDREESAYRIVEQFLIVFLWTIRDRAVHFSSLLLLKSSSYKLLDKWFYILDMYLLQWIIVNFLFCSCLKCFRHPRPFSFSFDLLLMKHLLMRWIHEQYPRRGINRCYGNMLMISDFIYTFI